VKLVKLKVFGKLFFYLDLNFIDLKLKLMSCPKQTHILIRSVIAEAKHGISIDLGKNQTTCAGGNELNGNEKGQTSMEQSGVVPSKAADVSEEKKVYKGRK